MAVEVLTDYSAQLEQLQDALTALNSSVTGVNETLMKVSGTVTGSAYLFEILTYCAVVVCGVYLVGLMLKFTFAR